MTVFLCGGFSRVEGGIPTTPEAASFESVSAVPAPSNLTTDLLYSILVGELAGQRGQLAVAVDAYFNASQLANDTRIFERAVHIALYAENYSQAMAIAKAWLMQEPGNAEAHKVLASLAARAGDIELAAKHFQKMLSYAPGNLEQRLFLVVSSLLGKGGQSDHAIPVMEALQVYYPEYAEVYYAHATLAILLKRFDLAEIAIQQALKLREQWSDALLLYSTILQQVGKVPQAAELLHKAVQQLPRNLSLKVGYGKLLVQQKLLAEAQQQFSSVLAIAPDNEEARYILAILALEIDDLEKAKKHFYVLVKQQKMLDEAAYYLGQIAEIENDYVQAESWYRQVNRGDSVLDAKIRLAVLLAKQGKLDDALRAMGDLRLEYPKLLARFYRIEGELLRNAQQYERAFAVYNDAVVKFPDDVDLLYERALMAEKQDRIDILEQDLLKILQMEPDNTHALNALGYTLADRTQRYEEALQYIERAFELQPEDPAVIDSMGWIQYRLGNYPLSLQFLRQAFAKNEDEEIIAHLVEVLWVSGARVEAGEVLQNATKKNPQNKKLQHLLQQYQP